MQTEKREGRTVVSQREWSNKFVKLASQLNHSEETGWKDRYRGHDKIQKQRTEE